MSLENISDNLFESEISSLLGITDPPEDRQWTVGNIRSHLTVDPNRSLDAFDRDIAEFIRYNAEAVSTALRDVASPPWESDSGTELHTALLVDCVDFCDRLNVLALLGDYWATENRTYMWQSAINTMRIPNPILGTKILRATRRLPATITLYAVCLPALKAGNVPFVTGLLKSPLMKADTGNSAETFATYLTPFMIAESVLGGERSYTGNFVSLGEWLLEVLRQSCQRAGIGLQFSSREFERLEYLIALSAANGGVPFHPDVVPLGTFAADPSTLPMKVAELEAWAKSDTVAQHLDTRRIDGAEESVLDTSMAKVRKFAFTYPKPVG